MDTPLQSAGLTLARRRVAAAEPEPVLTHRRRRIPKTGADRFATVIGRVVLVGATLYFLVPVYWLIVASTKGRAGLTSSFGFWFAEWNLPQNFESLMGWTQGYFLRWIGNSLLYSGLAGTIGTLLSVMAGYAIAKFAFPGKRIVVGMIMGGLLLPVTLLTIPLYVEFHALGISNSIWAVVLPSAVVPFGVFLAMVYSDSAVPHELLEAARIDGASELRIFLTIVTRLLSPAMVTIFLFIFVATWNNFLLPLMMISSAELKPVTLGLYGMLSYLGPDRGAALLGALMSIVPLVVLFLVLQRYWRSGLSAGAIKG